MEESAEAETKVGKPFKRDENVMKHFLYYPGLDFVVKGIK
jgi:hypothetical protein